MAEAVQLATLQDAAAVDRALGKAAAAGRFGEGDLAAILAYQARAAAGPAVRASGCSRRAGAARACASR